MKELNIYIDKKILDEEYEIYLKKFLDKHGIKSKFSRVFRDDNNQIIKYDYYFFLFAKYQPLNFWKKYKDSIINHTPAYKNIYYKNLLIKYLSDDIYTNLKYLPFSFVVDPKKDNTHNINNNIKIYKKLFEKNNLKNLWILKPYDGGLGNDIMICKEEDIHKNIRAFKKIVVIQKYIENPLLLNNKKFHIRVYVLIIPNNINNICKGYKVYYNNNYFACSSIVDYDEKKIEEKKIHITNASVQGYKTLDSNLMFFDKKTINEILVIDILDKKIKDICKTIFLKENFPNLINPYQEANCYELYGLDFLIDTNENVWLLEINVSPGLSIQTSTVRQKIVPQMMEDMFSLIFSNISDIKVSTTVKDLELLGKIDYLE